MGAELINYELEARLKNILKNKFTDERDLNEAFATLSTPEELSFYKEEEIDLMEIVLLNKDDKQTRLEKHVKDYFWILNNYLETTNLDIDYFKDQIKHTKKNDAEEFLAEIRDYQKTVRDTKKEIMEKLGLNKNEVKIVELLGEAIIFQDVRKKHNLKASYYLEEFLKEFSKRKDISVRDLKWLLPEELEKSEGLKDIIAKRKHITVLNCNKEKIDVKVQNYASKINKDLNKAEFEKSANIQGTVACTGKERYFRGVAKIIMSPKEGDKLKEGEILVTSMTTPDFVSCMKKAGAIITDIGGVTCHAAVVSREFGVPCIVGTGNATKSIKDGDILDLHNLRGVVKITSKS